MGSSEEGKIDRLCEDLKILLRVEVEAGNTVREVGEGWPREDSVLVMLEKPFIKATAEQQIIPKGVEYLAINDPHWWKEEYHCNIHNHILACRFE